MQSGILELHLAHRSQLFAALKELFLWRGDGLWLLVIGFQLLHSFRWQANLPRKNDLKQNAHVQYSRYQERNQLFSSQNNWLSTCSSYCIIYNKLNILLSIEASYQIESCILNNKDFQQKMSRSYKTQLKYEENESYHKDHVISTLKRELFELKDLEHDFMRLNDEVAGLESKYALMLDQKERSENQHKMKMQISKKNLTQLRNDVDSLKMQIHKTSVQIDDTLRQNSTLKRMCDNRQAEIASLMASNRQIEKNNELQIDQNKSLAHTLKTLKQQRNRAEQESEKLNKQLDQSINTLKQLQKQARQLEVSNSKLENILSQAQKDHSNLLQQMKHKQIELQKVNKDLKQLNQETEQLKQCNIKLERDCEKSQQQYKELCQKLEGSSTKNKELSQRLKTLQNTLRTTEAELDQTVIKRESLRKEHGDLANQNKVLNAQIDQCLMNILDYERINKNLQKQVQNYICCDEQVRSMLNRKQVMKGLLTEVTTKLLKTQQQIAHLR